MPSGKRGDGKLHITFNEMGHGDNVLISLPNGSMLMIDCGSMRSDNNYYQNPKPTAEKMRLQALRNMLTDERFLLNNKLIDLLIMTHPDKDHCVDIRHLFNTSLIDDQGTDQEKVYGPPTKATAVLYSNFFKEYGQHAVPGTLLGTGVTDKIYSVTINTTESKYGLLASYHTTKEEDYDSKGDLIPNEEITDSADDKAELWKKSKVAATLGFVKVLEGGSNPDCAVYLLASNVAPYNNLSDASSQDNRGSIVTMVVYGDKKFLFMGDGTFHTERFLIETYGDLVRDVELVHVGHHGSYSTSSSYPNHPAGNTTLDFVGHVNPRFAVITAAYDSGSKLALPRYEVISRFLAGPRLLDKPNTAQDFEKVIYCYEKESVSRQNTGNKKQKTDEENVWKEYPALKQVSCTGSHGPVDLDYEHKGNGVVGRV